MRPGQNEREVDLALKLTDEKLLIGDAALDNTGARSTGSTRLSANVSLNSALGWGELLTASGVHTEGSDYVRASGTLPVGAQGWRVGASASSMRYKLIADEFAALDGQGNRDNGFAGAPALNDYALKGAGLALGWQAGNGGSVRATWARRMGDNPNPTATGNDQDGSLVTNRFWLAASLTF
ncbi:MAG: ShlB/FhaC/HecB family hemolysin secretion/activation protein [Burkholderiales bacterium]